MITKAFPNEWNEDEGMDLRDYFAAKFFMAMLTVTKANYGYEGANERAAEDAYAAADVMMRVRGKK